MKFINTDAVVLIGQGSEWFWAMLTMIALTVTFVAIYRQLRAQRAAVAFEQLQVLQSEWQSDRMRYDSHRLAVGLRRGEEGTELQHFMAIIDFFEKLSFLQRQGYLDTQVLFDTFGTDVVRWWTVAAPLVEQIRIEYDPGELDAFERLAVQMRRIMAKRGVPAFETDAASIARRLDWMIERYARRLQIDDEFKTWMIPPPPAAPAAS